MTTILCQSDWFSKTRITTGQNLPCVRFFESVAQRHNKRTNDGWPLSGYDLYVRWQQQEGACVYCGASLLPYKKRHISLDHVIPLSKGGTNRLDNVVWCCHTCNSRKGDRIL